MRVLFVTPYPLSRIRIRAYGFVKQLAKHHQVTVLALCVQENGLADMEALQQEGVALLSIREERFKPYLRSLSALWTQQPLQVAYGASPALRSVLGDLLSSGQFDVLHIESLRALGTLPVSLPIPVVWDAVDCMSQLYEKGAVAGATTMLRLIGRSEAKRMRAYEAEQLRRFSHILVTSARDRQGLLDTSPPLESDKRAEITVLPHGIDRSYFQRYRGSRQPETLIFSGKMSFHANVAGALDLATHILPRIWRSRPNVRLIIAGSNPPTKIRRLARHPRIQITGYLSDLRPLIGQAQVAVCPLPYAVGIQNKVLEAMALGTPVVASSSASAGLQADHERELLIADEPERFAVEVLRLLDDQTLWNRLADGGEAYIARHHDWTSIVEQLTRVYAQAVGDQGGCIARTADV